MELSIIRRETTGAGQSRTVAVAVADVTPNSDSSFAAPNQYNESETITKFEIMDGAPVRGALIFLTPKSSEVLTTRLECRGNDSDSTLPWRIRAHADVPGCQQEVQHSLLPQSRPHRRRESTLFQVGLSFLGFRVLRIGRPGSDDLDDSQTTGDHSLPTRYARNRSDFATERTRTKARRLGPTADHARKRRGRALVARRRRAAGRKAVVSNMVALFFELFCGGVLSVLR